MPPDRRITVRYETLVARPWRVVERIYRRFDLGSPDAALSAALAGLMDAILAGEPSQALATVTSLLGQGTLPGDLSAEIREPVVRATIISPSEFIGTIMELCQNRRGALDGMDSEEIAP